MTDSSDEYGELLRRALSAEANSVVPSPDGLEIIRARVERRGLRWLMWWRTGASVAGALLVAATVVMVVPEFREQVIPQVSTGVVNYTETTPPDGSATSRPPAPPVQSAPAHVPPVVRSSPADTALPATPTSSRTARPTRPTSAPPTPHPTPTPSCPAPSDSAAIDRDETPEECEEAEATPAPATPSQSPCPADDCEPPSDVSPPMPTETTAPAPTPIGG